jgi:precorrin-2 C(20)-methyltransferase
VIVAGPPVPRPTRPGHLYGVGVGPGDPELLTLNARRVLGACPVIAHFAARHHRGNAWSIVAGFIDGGQTVLRLEYPVTTEPIDRAEYERLIGDFYTATADTIAALLDGGDDVAILCEGDPFFYGSYMHLHHRLSRTYPTTVVPGVTSLSAACAVAGTPLVAMH